MVSDRAEVVAPLEVDRESLLELARGGNLYGEQFACIRELIQNAADATLLRVFVERGADAFPTHAGSMRELRAILADYPIDVSIERVDDDTTGPELVPPRVLAQRDESEAPGFDNAGRQRRYRIAVDDRGIGIRREDHAHLQRVGSSRKNPSRAALIAAMPEWMRPSGTFGIGLQSAFLVSEQLILDTRSLDGHAHTIVLTAGNAGTISVVPGTRAHIGTRAELSITVSGAASMTRAAWRVREERDRIHDPLTDREIDLGLDEALVLATDCGRGSVVPVRVNGRSIPVEFTGANAIFDPETSIEIVLPTRSEDATPISRDVMPRVRRHADAAPIMFYRGSPVTSGMDGDGVRIAINLHASTARECLVLSRDHLSRTGGELLHPRLVAVVGRHLPAHLAALDASCDAPENLRCRLSLLLKTLSHPGAGESWRSLVVAVTKETDRDVTLGEVADGGRLEIVRPIVHRPTVDIEARSTHSVLADGTLASAPLPDAQESIRLVLPGAQLLSMDRHVRVREPGLVVANAFFLDNLSQASRAHALRPFLGLPSILPALRVPRFEAALRESAHAVADHQVLSPWTFRERIVEVRHVRKWITWTARPDDGPARTEADVAAGLVTLLRMGDPVLRADDSLTVAYELEAVIAEIEEAYPSARQS